MFSIRPLFEKIRDPSQLQHQHRKKERKKERKNLFLQTIKCKNTENEETHF